MRRNVSAFATRRQPRCRQPIPVGQAPPGRWRGSRGQALLEFALVLPLLLAFIIWLITIPSFLAWDLLIASNVADQAAQDGANAALRGFGPACQVATAEASSQIARSGMALQNVNVSCQVNDTADPRNPRSYGVEGTRKLIVTISFAVKLLLPGNVAISKTVTGWARIEGVVGP